MPNFKSYEIGEGFSLQIDLKDYLGQDHLCQQIEQIVSTLDLSMIESTYSNRGQKAFHPKMLLSIIFYGYTIGVRSGRKLATACTENLAFIYLSKGHQVSKSVLNDFRKNSYQHFSNLFDQVLQKCMAAQLADPSLSIIDGSKIRANSSKRRTKTKAQYEKWQQQLLADIASIEQELATQEPSVTTDQLKKN
jgi:transposase